MNQLHFFITIHAPVARVWDTMLGPESYKLWTAPFHAGSYYEGSWEQGAEIRFLIPSGDGMFATIAANRLHEFISIQHRGIVKQGQKDTSGPSWENAFENYTFTPTPEGARVDVSLDIEPAWEQYMKDTWPKALAALKTLCETTAAPASA